MRPLDLDYRRVRRIRAVAYVLMAAAIVLAADTAARYRALTLEIAAKQARLARVGGDRIEPKVLRSAVSADEYAFARQTALRLATPWNRLFQALEGAAMEKVALLAIEPDIESRTVSVSGEAKDYLAALSYVARLSEQRDAFEKVYLQRHEVRSNGSERPVAFRVSATWVERR